MQIQYPDLDKKTILVTGASRGIGREIAKTLASQGAHIAMNFLPGEEGSKEMAMELEKLGGKGTPIVFDITNTPQIKDAIDGFIKDHGAISGLVNNAGISKDQLLMRLKEEDLMNTLNINLKGAIMVTSLLSRNFLKASDVSIINISSIVGLMGNASQVAYSASKSGMIGVTKSTAKELASRNIRCNAICPGFIQTEMTDKLDEKVKEAYLAGIPMKSFGQTSDVANLVCFLMSKASSYITGETIKIDGGLYI